MTDLRYFISGSGNETVTFLHANSLDHRQWMPQVEYFSKRYRVLTYDLRGFGQSPNPIKSYSHGEDLKSLLDELGISKTHLVGSSLGGEQAVDFTLIYPEMVSSLTLIDSSLSGFPCSVNWDVGAKIDGVESAKERWLNHEVFKPTKKYPEAYKLLHEMVTDYSGSFWLTSHLCQKNDPPALNRLGNIKTPTLILIGEDDLPYFHAIAAQFHQDVSHSEIKIISNAGHLPNLEQADVVNKLVGTFTTQI